jgi:hypothetical protein
MPNSAQQSDLLHYRGFTGALASFIETGDPNMFKLTNTSIPGVPEVSSGSELVITPESFDTTEYSMLHERCNFWKTTATEVPI